MSLSEANRKYFDQITDTYDDKPWFAKVNQLVTTDLRARLDWVGIPFANTGSSSDAKDVRLLDYACGTGQMSRVYAPYVTVTRGMDVSPNMVATFNARARAADIPESRVSAVVGDLLDKKTPAPAEFDTPEWNGFDLATVGFAFHHFEDVVFAARQLKSRLRPGGVLVINDFLEGGDLKADENGDPIPDSEGDHAKHGHGQGHHHHHGHGNGHSHRSPNDDPLDDPNTRKDMEASVVTPHFTLDYVRDFFTEAGFVDVDTATMKERVYMEFGGAKMWRTILFAKGRRPVEEKSEL